MYDKCSKMHLRQRKVNKLKSKLLGEIDEELKDVFGAMKELYEPEKDLNWDEGARYANDLHNLFVLKRYLEYEYSFMGYHAIDEEQDIIVYQLSDKMLDVYSNMDMAVHRIVTGMELSGKPAELTMNDSYFERGLLTIFEVMVEDERLDSVIGKAEKQRKGQCFGFEVPVRFAERD